MRSDTCKKKILYYSHIDWAWIKQRPQFLAEELAKFYSVTVHYKVQYHKETLDSAPRVRNGIQLHPFRLLPAMKNRSRILFLMNSILRKQKLSSLLRKLKPEYLWLTYPMQILDVPDWYKGTVIYDCMDDHVNLDCPRIWADKIGTAEKALVQSSSVVFVSSRFLLDTLKTKYCEHEDKLVIVRNACSEDFCNNRLPCSYHVGSKIVAGYIGTISSWLDFESILESLHQFQTLEYELLGPIACENVPKHPRIHYRGVISHQDLASHAKTMDLLVMPFLDYPFIRSVDPVKLYEYVSFGRNILCSDYPEAHYFDGFVSFYKGSKDYCRKLQDLISMNERVYSDRAAQEFLSKNTWRVRAEQIHRVLEENAR